MDLAEAAERLRQAAAVRVDRLGLGRRVREAATASLDLDTFRSRSDRFFFGAADPGATIDAIRRLDPGDEARALRVADKVLDGRLPVFGRDHDLGSPPDWSLEPVTGVRYPSDHWSRLDYMRPAVGGEYKVIWETARHQYFLDLARAWLYSGDDRYAEAFAEHIRSFIGSNPPGRGVHWSSSLEVAFRAMSWIWALHLFRDARALTPALFQEILRSLVMHARHIECYLSTYFSPNTHLTGESLALYWIGTAFPELGESHGWRSRAWKTLRTQLPVQIREDGSYFEQSTAYARYTADFYLHLCLLRQRTGEPVPAGFLERLERALDALLALTRPDGTTAFIGDDDGGRLFPVDGRPDNDLRAPLGIGALVFGRPDFRQVAGPLSPEALWLLGPDAVTGYDALAPADPRSASTALVDGGLYVQRDGWQPESNMLLVDCGPLGTLNCGHAHADLLSIDAVVRGRPVVVDSGTFTYTSVPEERDRFRSGSAHNGVTVGGQGSSRPAGPFQWAHRADGEVLGWLDRPDWCWFSGRERFAGGAVHDRSILFVKGEGWIILDDVTGAGAETVELNFHLAPDLTTESGGEGMWWISDRVSGERVAGVAWSGVATIRAETVAHSPSYRRLANAEVLRVQPDNGDLRSTVTILGPPEAMDSLAKWIDKAVVLKREVDGSAATGSAVDGEGLDG